MNGCNVKIKAMMVNVIFIKIASNRKHVGALEGGIGSARICVYKDWF
jgi:hypothetical protein